MWGVEADQWDEAIVILFVLRVVSSCTSIDVYAAECCLSLIDKNTLLLVIRHKFCPALIK